MGAPTDRIEQHILLRAPLERVWHALTDASAFGAWFGMALDGPFVAGQPITGTIQPTQVDAEVARLQAPHAGTPFTLYVERIDNSIGFRIQRQGRQAGHDRRVVHPGRLEEVRQQLLFR